MKLKITLLLTIGAGLAAAQVQPQADVTFKRVGPGPAGPDVLMYKQEVGPGPFTVDFIGAEMSFGNEPVKGAPYAADAVTETTQVLSDGNRITRKSTATTKSTEGTRLVLEHFDLLAYFDHIQGSDGLLYKPAPDVILASVKALGASPEDCLMIGDSPADMEAGRRAGVSNCAVRYGYGDPEKLAALKPDYWVSDLRELIL